MPDGIVGAAILGYLAGAVPFGLILSRLAGLGDIRRIGSGNIGATNVLRTGRRDIAAATLVLDGGKGAALALAFQAVSGTEAGLIAGFAAVLGHDFPVWLRFRGGKGVATSLGVLLATCFPVGAGACAVWLAAAALFRFSSLAALLSLAAAPLIALSLSLPQHALMASGLALLALIRHRGNVGRLLSGEEPRIGQKRPANRS